MVGRIANELFRFMAMSALAAEFSGMASNEFED
jgi:hypothetical protein